MEEDELSLAIERLSKRYPSDDATAAAVALANLIPTLGGVIASAVGEYGSQRRHEKVCDILKELKDTLDRHKVEPEKHLNKDQIVEVVHETLQTSVTASDQEKIDALKNGLGYAFLSDDPFQKKQVFLQVLRSATPLELRVIRKVYEVDDPYVVYEGRPPVPLNQTGMMPIDGSSLYDWSGAQARYRRTGNAQRGQKTLLRYLAEQLSLDEPLADGVLRLLDSRGLTNAAQNLGRSDSAIMAWEDHTVAQAHRMVAYQYKTDEGEPSPLQSMRTAFGREFIQVCSRDWS
jgi:hypothetical protein